MSNRVFVEHPETGERMNLNELARSTGINPVTLNRRYHRGERGMALIDKTKLKGPRYTAPKRQAQTDPGQNPITANLDRATQALATRHMADIGRLWAGKHARRQ